MNQKHAYLARCQQRCIAKRGITRLIAHIVNFLLDFEEQSICTQNLMPYVCPEHIFIDYLEHPRGVDCHAFRKIMEGWHDIP